MASGYSPPWPEPSADPADPGSDFRVYLDRSLNRLWAAGIQATNDLSKVDVNTWNGLRGDFDLDGAVTPADLPWVADCLSGPGAWPAPPEPVTPDECLWGADLDSDTDVDLTDFAAWQMLVE